MVTIKNMADKIESISNVFTGGIAHIRIDMFKNTLQNENGRICG